MFYKFLDKFLLSYYDLKRTSSFVVDFLNYKYYMEEVRDKNAYKLIWLDGYPLMSLEKWLEEEGEVSLTETAYAVRMVKKHVAEELKKRKCASIL